MEDLRSCYDEGVGNTVSALQAEINRRRSSGQKDGAANAAAPKRSLAKFEKPAEQEAWKVEVVAAKQPVAAGKAAGYEGVSDSAKVCARLAHRDD